MSDLLIIECVCRNTTSVLRSDLAGHPNSSIVCKGLLKDGPQCGRVIKVQDLLRLPRHIKTHIITPEQEELGLR